jgi:hypothetical protein
LSCQGQISSHSRTRKEENGTSTSVLPRIDGSSQLPLPSPSQTEKKATPNSPSRRLSPVEVETPKHAPHTRITSSKIPILQAHVNQPRQPCLSANAYNRSLVNQPPHSRQRLPWIALLHLQLMFPNLQTPRQRRIDIFKLAQTGAYVATYVCRALNMDAQCQDGPLNLSSSYPHRHHPHNFMQAPPFPKERELDQVMVQANQLQYPKEA